MGGEGRGTLGVRKGYAEEYSGGTQGGSGVLGVLRCTLLVLGGFRKHARARALPPPHTRMQKLAHAHAHTLGRMHTHAGTRNSEPRVSRRHTRARTDAFKHTHKTRTNTHARMQFGPITVSLFLALSCDMLCVDIWLHVHRSRTYTSVHVYISAHRNAHARAHARVCMLIRGDTPLSLLLGRAHTHSHAHAHTHTHICRLILTHTRARAHTYNARGIV